MCDQQKPKEKQYHDYHHHHHDHHDHRDQMLHQGPGHDETNQWYAQYCSLASPFYQP